MLLDIDIRPGSGLGMFEIGIRSTSLFRSMELIWRHLSRIVAVDRPRHAPTPSTRIPSGGRQV